VTLRIPRSSSRARQQDLTRARIAKLSRPPGRSRCRHKPNDVDGNDENHSCGRDVGVRPQSSPNPQPLPVFLAGFTLSGLVIGGVTGKIARPPLWLFLHVRPQVPRSAHRPPLLCNKKPTFTLLFAML